MKIKILRSCLLVALALAGSAMLGPQASAQLAIAEDLLVDIDATLLAEGPITAVANAGTAGGVFEATGGGNNAPKVIYVGGNGTPGIRFDGNDFMEHKDSIGGAVLPAPAGLVGLDPTRTIEVWVYNITVPSEETLVSIGRRGGPEGANCSFGYGTSGAFGAVGHWGFPDIGWNNAGGAPAAGQWHHLVYSYDGTTTRVYIDGVLANSEVVGAGIINTHNNGIVLAAQREGNGTVTVGLRGSLVLSRVRIHNGVLSDAEVLNNYNVESADFIVGSGTATLSGLVHRYTFNGSAAADATGLAVEDITSGANGIVRNASGTTTFTGTKVTLSGGSPATAPYVDLPNGLISALSADNGGSGEITIEGWVTITGNRSWSRIFDIGSCTAGEITGPGGTGSGADYLMMTAQIGTDLNNRRCEVKNDDPLGGGIAGTTTYDFGSYTLNQDYHFAVTWNESTGQIIIYENGIEVGSFVTDKRPSNLNDVNVWLGRSNWLADNNLQGDFDEFRIFSRVLPADEIRASFLAGPNLGLEGPGPLQAIHLQVDAEMIDRTFQNATVIADYLNASGIVVTSADGVTFESSDESILTVTASGRIQAVSQGSADITARLEGQSDTVTVTVVPLTTTMEHRYSFDTDASDSVGTADGTLLNGAFVANGEVLMAAATEDAVQLPAGIISGYTAVTVEAWASFGANAGWNRLFDFGNTNLSALGIKYILFTPHSGAGDIRMSISDADPGYNNEQWVSVPGNLDGQTNVHIVTVFFPLAGIEELYLNGCLVASRNDVTIQLSDVDDQVNYIGRSLYGGDADLNGSVNEFRIYNGVLTPEQVALNYAAGPDAFPGDAGALVSVSLDAQAEMLIDSTQTASLLGNFENITGVPLCGLGTPTYESSDEAIFTVDSEGLVTAMGAGTATLTGIFDTFQDTVSITVTNLPVIPVVIMHRYSFGETTGMTTAADSIGGADGAVLGNGAFNGGGQLVLDGSSGTYVNLPNGILSALTDVTFEAWVTQNAIANWSRVFDFGISAGGEDVNNGGVNYLFFSPRGSDGLCRFAAKATGVGETPILTSAPFTTGVETHVAVVYSPTLGIARLYVDGSRVASGRATTPLSAIQDVNNWLGRAQYNDPYFNGAFNEFRIFEGVMTDEQVEASFAAGPDANIGGLKLTIRYNPDGSVTISWPNWASEYFVETSDSVDPDAFWDLLFEFPVDDGTNFNVTVPAALTSQYFRLSR